MANPTSTNAEHGIEVLRDPTLNKFTAFTETERQALRTTGLVLDVTETEELQIRRVLQHLGHKLTDLERHIYLVNLPDNDEALSLRAHFRSGAISFDPVRRIPRSLRAAGAVDMAIRRAQESPGHSQLCARHTFGNSRA